MSSSIPLFDRCHEPQTFNWAKATEFADAFGLQPVVHRSSIGTRICFCCPVDIKPFFYIGQDADMLPSIFRDEAAAHDVMNRHGVAPWMTIDESVAANEIATLMRKISGGSLKNGSPEPDPSRS
ncbi:hypothetical protein [Massilia sp. LC238]|jgi:hypothetical protein|uniref:hypothetical protein n=1 Tax=Massilia sp. LC238 TaxID=1502852 RepID=UPI0012699B42|nr:hypothetical protein [Massilia sp. LC238]